MRKERTRRRVKRRRRRERRNHTGLKGLSTWKLGCDLQV